MAFVFGSERFGMRNDDVYRCHVCLRIPTADDYGSLNLAAAVQLIAYEWREALGGFDASAPVEPPHQARADDLPADGQAIAGMLDHWHEALVAVGYLDPRVPRKLMPRLHQLVNRAQPTTAEVHILRGVARAVLQAASRSTR
jgi:tRNA/rRNA methyltransferase